MALVAYPAKLAPLPDDAEMVGMVVYAAHKMLGE